MIKRYLEKSYWHRGTYRCACCWLGSSWPLRLLLMGLDGDGSTKCVRKQGGRKHLNGSVHMKVWYI